MVVVRVDPATLRLPAERAGWAPRGHPRLLEDLHPRRLRDLAVSLPAEPIHRVARAGAGVPLPLLDVRRARRRQRRVRPRRTAAAAAAAARSTAPACCARLGRCPGRSARPGGETRREPHRASDRPMDAVAFVDERLGAARGMRFADGLRVPRPLELPARRDRAVLVRRAGPHRHVPGAVLRPGHDAGRLPRQLPGAAGPERLGRLRLDAAPLRSTCRAGCSCARPTTGRRWCSSRRSPSICCGSCSPARSASLATSTTSSA